MNENQMNEKNEILFEHEKLKNEILLLKEIQKRFGDVPCYSYRSIFSNSLFVFPTIGIKKITVDKRIYPITDKQLCLIIGHVKKSFVSKGMLYGTTQGLLIEYNDGCYCEIVDFDECIQELQKNILDITNRKEE